MRVTLVNVSEGFETGIIPLGLISIATYIKKNGRFHQVRLLDSNCEDIYGNFSTDTDLVGISAVTQDLKRAQMFARFVKSKCNIPVVIGGVHVSTCGYLPEPFDLGVIGEGEETMLESIECGFGPEKIKLIKGICYNEGGETVYTEPRPFIKDLDTIPIPDRDIANMAYYLTPRQIIPYNRGISLTMLSSRGCPFDCAFCSTKQHWKRFRAFSAERVVEEIELLLEKYNAEIIHIFDDLFVVNKKRLKQIHNKLISKGIHRKAKFMCLARSDSLDEATMHLLKEMNVVVIGIGMESGSDRVLSQLKKQSTTVEENRRAIEMSHMFRIPIMGSFIIGNPGETEEELIETLDFIQSYRHTPYLSPLIYIATPYPGTEFWDEAKMRGLDVENTDTLQMDIPYTQEPLRSASLLTDIPVDRFFEIAQLFSRELEYVIVKKKVYISDKFHMHLRAYLRAIILEGSIRRGISEVNWLKKQKVASGPLTAARVQQAKRKAPITWRVAMIIRGTYGDIRARLVKSYREARSAFAT